MKGFVIVNDRQALRPILLKLNHYNPKNPTLGLSKIELYNTPFSTTYLNVKASGNLPTPFPVEFTIFSTSACYPAGLQYDTKLQQYTYPHASMLNPFFYNDLEFDLKAFDFTADGNIIHFTNNFTIETIKRMGKYYISPIPSDLSSDFIHPATETYMVTIEQNKNWSRNFKF